jgi:hypothetical protein
MTGIHFQSYCVGIGFDAEGLVSDSGLDGLSILNPRLLVVTGQDDKETSQGNDIIQERGCSSSINGPLAAVIEEFAAFRQSLGVLGERVCQVQQIVLLEQDAEYVITLRNPSLDWSFLERYLGLSQSDVFAQDREGSMKRLSEFSSFDVVFGDSVHIPYLTIVKAGLHEKFKNIEATLASGDRLFNETLDDILTIARDSGWNVSIPEHLKFRTAREVALKLNFEGTSGHLKDLERHLKSLYNLRVSSYWCSAADSKEITCICYDWSKIPSGTLSQLSADAKEIRSATTESNGDDRSEGLLHTAHS